MPFRISAYVIGMRLITFTSKPMNERPSEYPKRALNNGARNSRTHVRVRRRFFQCKIDMPRLYTNPSTTRTADAASTGTLTSHSKKFDVGRID